jgi:hypothetical protein
MTRLLSRMVLALAIFFVVMFVVDWAVWRVRVARGGGMGSVNVTNFQVASLKGGKEEYYPDGQGPVACSQSLFPQGGTKPCWYMVKHPVVFER